MPLRQGADASSGLIVHPTRDESLDATDGVDDPERGVLGPDQWTDPIDDDLEGIIDRGETGDPSDGRIEGGVNPARAARHNYIRIEHRPRG